MDLVWEIKSPETVVSVFFVESMILVAADVNELIVSVTVLVVDPTVVVTEPITEPKSIESARLIKKSKNAKTFIALLIYYFILITI